MKFQLLYFEQDANGGYGLALQVLHFTVISFHCEFEILFIDAEFRVI